MHFKDKVIWITGASSGIGAALAKKFVLHGANLILTARNVSTLEQMAKEFGVDNCKVLVADLTETNIKQLVADAIGLFGYIDVAIHSAGITQRSLAVETSTDVYRKLMEIDFFAPVEITNELMPHFSTRPYSHVVPISSIAGLMGFPMRTGYSAAKHALHGFFETLQVEHTVPNMHITIVSPGRINTPISFSALKGNGQQHNKMDEGQLNGIPVDVCADKIIGAIKKKKRHVLIAKQERLLWWFWWWWPNLYYRIARKAGMKNEP